jgi:hypothetical protein
MRRFHGSPARGVALAAVITWAGTAASLPSARADDTPTGSATTSASPTTDADEAARRAALLASPRWRRASFELHEWLATQKVYPPEEVRRIEADLAERVARMSSYELEYMLDMLTEKLRILESPSARETREWLGRYLSVMAERKRAEVVATIPNMVDMSAAQLQNALAELDEKRAAVEKRARDAARGRREFGTFVRDRHEADKATKAALSRLRRGDVAFSPYRSQPVDDPPFATGYESQTVVGVGPWGTFIGMNIGAY